MPARPRPTLLPSPVLSDLLQSYLALPLKTLHTLLRPYGKYDTDKDPDTFPNVLIFTPALWDEEVKKGWIPEVDVDQIAMRFGVHRRTADGAVSISLPASVAVLSSDIRHQVAQTLSEHAAARDRAISIQAILEATDTLFKASAEESITYPQLEVGRNERDSTSEPTIPSSPQCDPPIIAMEDYEENLVSNSLENDNQQSIGLDDNLDIISDHGDAIFSAYEDPATNTLSSCKACTSLNIECHPTLTARACSYCQQKKIRCSLVRASEFNRSEHLWRCLIGLNHLVKNREMGEGARWSEGRVAIQKSSTFMRLNGIAKPPEVTPLALGSNDHASYLALLMEIEGIE